MNTKKQSDEHKPIDDGRARVHAPARGLVVLNLVLLAVLGAVMLAPGATAQVSPAGTRVRGEYLLAGGATISGVTSVIYVLDSANHEMIALNWNDSSKSLEGIGYRDLVRDASSDPDR